MILSLALLTAMATPGVAVLRRVAGFLTLAEQYTYGACMGVAVATIAFVPLASVLGFSTGLVVADGAACVAIAWLVWPQRPSIARAASRDAWQRLPARARSSVESLVHQARAHWIVVSVVGVFGVRWLLLYSNVLQYRPDGLWANQINVWGDWPVHLGIETSFAYGQNFPPTHPRFAGHAFGYHYLTDLTPAAFVKLGMDPVGALLLHSFLLSVLVAIALVLLIRRLTRDDTVAALGLVLYLLGGSIAWVLTLQQANASHDLLGTLLTQPFQNAGLGPLNIRWVDVFFGFLEPQRAYLYGLPMGALILTILVTALERRAGKKAAHEAERAGAGGAAPLDTGRGSAVATIAARAVRLAVLAPVGLMLGTAAPPAGPDPAPRIPSAAPSLIVRPPHPHAHGPAATRPRRWWLPREEERLFLAAGVVAGLLPLAHLSMMLALALATPFLVLLFPSRGWIYFLFAWGVIAAPQVLMQEGGGAGPLASMRVDLGWVAAPDPWWWFWLKNLGWMIPLAIVALAGRTLLAGVPRRLLLGFMGIFVVENVMVFQPWDWDNTKELAVWFLAVAILVAALLVRTWRAHPTATVRLLVATVVATSIGSSLLVNLQQLEGRDSNMLITSDELRLVQLVRAQTPPHAIFVTGDWNNHPIPMLSGRRIVVGYSGWLWTEGIDGTARLADVRAIYADAPDTPELLAKYDASYIVIGPGERDAWHADVAGLEARYPVVIRTATYVVLHVTPPATASR